MIEGHVIGRNMYPLIHRYIRAVGRYWCAIVDHDVTKRKRAVDLFKTPIFRNSERIVRHIKESDRTVLAYSPVKHAEALRGRLSGKGRVLVIYRDSASAARIVARARAILASAIRIKHAAAGNMIRRYK